MCRVLRLCLLLLFDKLWIWIFIFFLYFFLEKKNFSADLVIQWNIEFEVGKVFVFCGFSLYFAQNLQKINNIGRHFFNCGVVKLLDVVEGTSILISYEVYSYAFTTESSTAANSVYGRIVNKKKGNILGIRKIAICSHAPVGGQSGGSCGVFTCECSFHDLTANRSW